MLSDPAIYEFERAPPISLEQLAALYRRLETRTSADGREKWLNWVVRLPNQALAGYVQATVMQSGVAYVAYELGSKYWRQGIGSASVTAMMEELADKYDVRVFVAVLKAVNFRSTGLLKHLGFELLEAGTAAQYGPESDEIVMVKIADR